MISISKSNLFRLATFYDNLKTSKKLNFQFFKNLNQLICHNSSFHLLDSLLLTKSSQKLTFKEKRCF